MEHTATAFLSYKRENTEEVKYLQQQLKVRGVRAWRDVSDLSLGDYTRDKTVQAIEHESDAFVIYITRECLASTFIWDVEVPIALKRWDRDHAFNVVSIFRGVSLAEVQQLCTARGYRSLTEFNAARLPDSITSETDEIFKKELRSVAGRILKATVELRLRRMGAAAGYVPCICFRNFEYRPSTPGLDLDLDWTELFNGKRQVPTEQEWEEASLLAALHDVKNVLSSKISSGKLHIFLKARLPAAFALGFVLSARSPFTLLLQDDEHGLWSTGEPASEVPLLRRLDHHGRGNPRVAVVEVAISRKIHLAVSHNLLSLGISCGYHIELESLDGQSDELVKNAAQAMGMARQVRQELKRLFDHEGVAHVHLFASLPDDLAVMVGRQLNALGAITCYHYVSVDKVYVPVCTLK